MIAVVWVNTLALIMVARLVPCYLATFTSLPVLSNAKNDAKDIRFLTQLKMHMSKDANSGQTFKTYLKTARLLPTSKLPSNKNSIKKFLSEGIDSDGLKSTPLSEDNASNSSTNSKPASQPSQIKTSSTISKVSSIPKNTSEKANTTGKRLFEEIDNTIESQDNQKSRREQNHHNSSIIESHKKRHSHGHSGRHGYTTRTSHTRYTTHRTTRYNRVHGPSHHLKPRIVKTTTTTVIYPAQQVISPTQQPVTPKKYFITGAENKNIVLMQPTQLLQHSVLPQKVYIPLPQQTPLPKPIVMISPNPTVIPPYQAVRSNLSSGEENTPKTAENDSDNATNSSQQSNEGSKEENASGGA